MDDDLLLQLYATRSPKKQMQITIGESPEPTRLSIALLSDNTGASTAQNEIPIATSNTDILVSPSTASADSPIAIPTTNVPIAIPTTPIPTTNVPIAIPTTPIPDLITSTSAPTAISPRINNLKPVPDFDVIGQRLIAAGDMLKTVKTTRVNQYKISALIKYEQEICGILQLMIEQLIVMSDNAFAQ